MIFMRKEELLPGVVIEGPNWDDYIIVEKVESVGRWIRILGQKRGSGEIIDHMVGEDDLARIRVITELVDLSGSPERVFLALEALRYRFIAEYDPLLAMNVSKVDPLPHQIEAVYGWILKMPRIRFLLADDPGAGKTIMAGLIIKELKLRGLVRRVLIVVPGHLKDQWRREMKDRFGESFVVVDRGYMGSHYGENVWLRENQIITSMDFAKQPEIRGTLEGAYFDLIVVDEAHKMSAYSYGNRTNKTERYRLGEVLSRITPHLLFLTATPHKGDPENFRLFLDLLYPGFFKNEKMLKEAVSKKENPIYLRRRKEDLMDFEGKPIFLPRHVHTLAFDLTDEEMDLYNDVSRYVHDHYNRALQSEEKKRNVAFALVILQRRLASSTYALLRSLQRRKEKLQDLLTGAEKIPEMGKLDLEELEDLSEEERWKVEEKWLMLSTAESRDELREEIRLLEGLIEQAKGIIERESEVKLKNLRETLEELNRRFPHEKVLIFTESKDTLEYLEKKIKDWGYSVNTIHGGMSLEDRIRAESIFKNETQVMVATEAAGEGINLQFCHLMINYDLPWNPNRLEQRMGRIHRYGQTKEVFVYNLVALNTREGRVLNKLFEKLEEIKEALGSDKVFDVVSEVIYGKNLSQYLVEAAVNARDVEEILREIDFEVDEEYISRVKEQMGESLATRHIDYTRIKEMAEKAREQRLIPEYTQAYFTKAFEVLGGSMRRRADGFLHIEKVPSSVRGVADREDFKRIHGTVLREYRKATFDKDQAFKHPDVEFISFGHPLFEALLTYMEENFSAELRKGSVFVDPDGRLNGYILFYVGEVRDGGGSIAGRRLFSVYVEGDKAVNIPPSVIWDLSLGPSEREKVNIERLDGTARVKVLDDLQKYREELLKERKRQAEIKKNYGMRSLSSLTMELRAEVARLKRRKDKGENVDLALRNKEAQLQMYIQAQNELREQIKRETNLTITNPRFVGIIRVVPPKIVEEAMQSDEEIERIGMDIVMAYERNEGRIPEDVSAENMGFDIRSRNEKGEVVRYIEVKARAGVGKVALTQNEWFKALRFGEDYYLYVVYNAASTPELHIIRDPARNVTPEKIVESVRFVVDPKSILSAGEVKKV